MDTLDRYNGNDKIKYLIGLMKILTKWYNNTYNEKRWCAGLTEYWITSGYTWCGYDVTQYFLSITRSYTTHQDVNEYEQSISSVL